jgi:hypothetical protein
MDYIEADEKVFALLNEQQDALWSTLGRTAFPNTYRAMFGFCVKANLLKTALFDMVEAENPYAFKALLRCFCEHYVRFTYLFIRFLREKSDAVGIEYFSYCGAAEAWEHLRAIRTAGGLLGNTVDADELEASIRSAYPRAAVLSKAQLREASGRFNYRSILHALSHDVQGAISTSNPFLATIVPAYARLSSYVHGGPRTESEMLAFAEPEGMAECGEEAALVFMMAACILAFTAMAVSREFPEHGAFADRIFAVIHQYQAQPDR